MIGKPVQVWIVDDDASIRWVLERALRNAGLQPRSFETGETARDALKHEAPDVLMTDIRMAGMSGLQLAEEVRKSRPTLPVIVMTAHADLDNAVSAFASGAFEYLPKPFDIDQAVALVRRAALSSPTAGLDPELVSPTPELLGRAPAMQQVFRAIGRLSRTTTTVLITGESGTGKELVARALHEHSPRAARKFVALNMSAIPGELLESELFGHEKGSFTGADAQRRGRFEQADGGTLFLDEIGDMPIALQTRLLRVLAEGEFYRVGGQTPIKVEVRVVAATNQDLLARVASGQFREDLYHRLNVINIHLPPLRERTEDIAMLLAHYLRLTAAEMGVDAKSLASAAESALVSYRWPGNVRELVNLSRRMTVLAPGREIQVEDLPADMQLATKIDLGGMDDWAQRLARWADSQLDTEGAPLLDVAAPEFERVLALAALRRTHGHKQEAARRIGWGRNTLTRKLRELGIDEHAEP